MSTPVPPAASVRDESLADALGQRYLAYALAAITDRALPDVRDGLKPVHRRLLYAMRMLRLTPDTPHKKCARVVGDVIGKYHPHGDQAVYEALARLAQDFSVRYPLVDGQGNFGNVDGDAPAAMRYTEARLTPAAELLLSDAAEGIVPFRPNYDESEIEPEVLPAAFPNLLANGASGIAVGMATEIPPHNLDELCVAAVHLLKHPEADTAALLTSVQGPDFPGGGLLCESRESMLQAYMTGKGAFRLRAKIEREELPRGGYAAVVTQIPYRVQKSRLIERIAELIDAKKLPLIEDVRDESDDQIRIVIEPKTRNVDFAQLTASLYRACDLEVRVPLNMTVLDPQRVPRVMSLKDVLVHYLDHRRQMLVNRSRVRLQRIDERLHVLDALLIVYAHLDEVIRIIRESDDAKAQLCKRFALTEVQAEAILNLRLRALAKLEEAVLRREHAALSTERAALAALLGSHEAQTKALIAELNDVRARYGVRAPGGARRTQVIGVTHDLPVPAAAVVREPLTVVCSQKERLRAFKGHIAAADVKYREGDGEAFVLHVHTDEKPALISSGGRLFSLTCDRLPDGRGVGEPLRMFAALPDGQTALALLRTDVPILVAASDGCGFVLPAEQAEAGTKTGKQIGRTDLPLLSALSLTGDRAALCDGRDRLLVIDTATIPRLAKGKGVQLMRCRDTPLMLVKVFNDAEGLLLPGLSEPLTGSALRAYTGARAGTGRALPGRRFL